MTTTFTPLTTDHFPLLLKWLETPHVKAWWDADVIWTPELIQEKYGTYVDGFKPVLVEGQEVERPIQTFIIKHDETPIGYIQLYNVHDFPRADNEELLDLPPNCATFDWYIGEPDYVGQGIGGHRPCDSFWKPMFFLTLTLFSSIQKQKTFGQFEPMRKRGF